MREDESAMSFLQGQDLRTVPQIYTDKVYTYWWVYGTTRENT